MSHNDRQEVFKKIQLAQGGDEIAKEQLVKDNIKLVYKIAQHYRNSTCEYDDIIQSGMVGLVNAILRFDTSYNVAFSTYAFPLILGEIRKLLRENSMIKKSRAVNETLSLIKEKKQEFINDNNREPTINELSELCGIEREKIVFVLNSILPVQSLESKIYDSEDTLVDKIESNENTQESAIQNVLIKKITKDLDKRSKKIIYMRYYQGKTQSDVAKEIGVSQVQISRIEKKLLLDMRKMITG